MNSRVVAYTRSRSFRLVAGSLRGAMWAVRSLFFLNGFMFASWATRIPAFRDTYHLDNAQLGIALIGVAFGALISMPMAGWLCEKFGSNRICTISAILYLLSLVSIAFAPNLIALGVLLISFGVGHGLLDVAMNLQVVEIEDRLKKTVMSTFHALWSVGGLAGAITGVLLTAADFTMQRHFVVTSLAMGLLVWVIRPFLLPQRKHSTGDAQTASHGLSFRFTKKTMALGVVAFCVMLCEGAMADWSAVFLHDVLGANEILSAVAYAIFALTMASGRFAGDALVERWGSAKQVYFSAILAVAGLLCVTISNHPAVALIGFGLVGAGLATIVPIVFSVSGKLNGISAGVALGSVSTVGYLGFLLGPPAIGFISQWLHLRVAFGLLIILTVVVVFLAQIVKPDNTSTEQS
ncbi:MFS transporter [Lacunimicrobium album]